MSFDENQSSAAAAQDATSPRERIIAAAERAFAAQGIDTASLRSITAAASVNVAAVNYYFGSKQELIYAVLDRLAERVNQRRMKRLDALFANGATPDLEAVIGVFVAPYLRPETREEGDLLLKLLLKHRSAPNEITREIIGKHFNPLSHRFIAALKQLLPEVDELDLTWRYFFMVGSVLFGVSETGDGGRIGMLTEGRANPSDTDGLVRQLTAFLVGGVSAPSTSKPMETPAL